MALTSIEEKFYEIMGYKWIRELIFHYQKKLIIEVITTDDNYCTDLQFHLNRFADYFREGGAPQHNPFVYKQSHFQNKKILMKNMKAYRKIMIRHMDYATKYPNIRKLMKFGLIIGCWGYHKICIKFGLFDELYTSDNAPWGSLFDYSVNGGLKDMGLVKLPEWYEGTRVDSPRVRKFK